MVTGERRFGRADEHPASRMARAQQHPKAPRLRLAIEVNKQIAAEYKIIGRRFQRESGVEQIAGTKAYPLADCIGEHETVWRVGEVTIAKGQVVTAK